MNDDCMNEPNVDNYFTPCLLNPDRMPLTIWCRKDTFTIGSALNFYCFEEVSFGQFWIMNDETVRDIWSLWVALCQN
jgi:hypothetical protein